MKTETANIKFETSPGDTFDRVAQKSYMIASNKKSNVEFDFNGIKCIVSSSTNINHLYRDYQNSFVMDWKVIGPDCLAQYEPEVADELSKSKAIREEKQRLQNIAHEQSEKQQRLKLSKKVDGIEISILDKVVYDDWKSKNQDSYGGCCFEYAEAWAKLMQLEIAKGKTVKDVAERTSRELAFFGITGFMYSMVISILSNCWEHGEELKQWHHKSA